MSCITPHTTAAAWTPSTSPVPYQELINKQASNQNLGRPGLSFMLLYRCRDKHCSNNNIRRLFYFHFTIDYILNVQWTSSLTRVCRVNRKFRNWRHKRLQWRIFPSSENFIKDKAQSLKQSKPLKIAAILHSEFCSYTRLGIRWVSIGKICCMRFQNFNNVAVIFISALSLKFKCFLLKYHYKAF